MIFSQGTDRPEPPDDPEKDEGARNSRSHLTLVK
jgi:hypothetical protein